MTGQIHVLLGHVWFRAGQMYMMKYSFIDCLAGQHDRQDESLTGQIHNQSWHCPLTGRYFEPWTKSKLEWSILKCNLWSNNNVFVWWKVCHGDIKTENVMVTGWNWVLLTDIASFKPAILPEDNPADFNFFFDTSRRRSCYVAPERFLDSRQADQMLSKGVSTAVDPQSKSKDHSLPDMDFVRHQQGNLTPEMDIFSAG